MIFQKFWLKSSFLFIFTEIEIFQFFFTEIETLMNFHENWDFSKILAKIQFSEKCGQN